MVDEEYSSHTDVFKGFARTTSEFIKEFKGKNSYARKWLIANGYNPDKINKSMIEIEKGRCGNWNNYVKEFEGIKVKPGEKWYEFRLIVYKVPKKV